MRVSRWHCRRCLVAAAYQVKFIKPSTLKQDKMRLAFLNAMRKQATEIKAEFKKTTATWEHKVKFESIVGLRRTPPGPELLVWTDDEIYGYVNNGTRPHPIFPRRAKALVFQWGGKGSYKPKTKPRVIGSGPSSISNPQTWRLPYVDHPGIKEGRHFDEEIEKKHRPKFKRAMEQAMSDARKASGHAI